MLLFYKFRKALAFYIFSHFYKKQVSLKLDEPLISFTFDDVPRSAIDNGEAILKKYNYSGTYYISIDLMKREGFDFKATDSTVLTQIVAGGSELACHTYSHLHFFEAGEDEIIADLKINLHSINSLVPGYQFKNISYPFGEQSLKARKILRQKFRSARSVYRGINNGYVDLNCLRSIRLYNSISLNEIVKTIEKAIETKSWIIFYTHDVDPNPTSIGCSPGYFEEVVKYCYEKKLKVVTINEALDLIQN
jgi:peptidoglycan/xylan/chitin deacetylase (PgdA/CDA1 family)